MRRPLLTVLTTPVLAPRRRAYQKARGALRRIVKPGVPLPRSSRYPGHYALVRSVVEGLHAIHADFNFNPRRFSDVARIVYAPANEALQQAIELKRHGTIRYLVAGPVNALFADECGGILLEPEIDRVIVPSKWTMDLYEGYPALVAKSRVCPCGVDEEVWRPSGRTKERTAVVYWKSGDERFCEGVEAVVRRCGLEPVRVSSKHGEHGMFKPEAYRDALDRAMAAVFLSTFETQGIALAEAWSMNVPTVVWDPQALAEWRSRSFRSRSSAPYLSGETGRAFRAIDELEETLGRTLDSLASFQPRAWVLRHMTDAVCARQLYELITRGASSADDQPRL
jgi:glycosyltransferase involved in cell wall biosynthesis